MRAIQTILRLEKPIILPLAYNELQQGLIYSCWKDTFPAIHDRGFGESKPMRLFTFGPLAGKRSINTKAKTIRFEDSVSFEIRSPLEELLDEYVQQIASRDTIRIGVHELELSSLLTRDRLIFPSRAVIRMTSPVVAYTTLDDGHTQYYSPDSEEWLRLIQQNARNKQEAFGLEGNFPFMAIPRTETLRKHVTRFKGTYITGWTGDLIVVCDASVLSLLYYTGIGAKNSQGFGMFEILDEKI